MKTIFESVVRTLRERNKKIDSRFSIRKGAWYSSSRVCAIFKRAYTFLVVWDYIAMFHRHTVIEKQIAKPTRMDFRRRQWHVCYDNIPIKTCRVQPCKFATICRFCPWFVTSRCLDVVDPGLPYSNVVAWTPMSIVQRPTGDPLPLRLYGRFDVTQFHSQPW